MRNLITANDIANTARMMRTQHSGSILIVEGATDIKFFETFCHPQHCRILAAHSKSNVLGAIDIITTSSPGFLAIVDSDFDRINEHKEERSNVFRTDTHDVESLLLASPALDKVVRMYGSKEKVKALDYRELLLKGGELIGILRLISLKDKMQLSFEDLTYTDFLDKDSLRIDANKMIRSIKNKSSKHSLPEVDVKDKLDSMVGRYEPWHVCCGHDLVNILSVGLRKRFGSCKLTEVHPEALEKCLRLAYEAAYFLTTALYRLIKQWEVQSNFVVLAV